MHQPDGRATALTRTLEVLTCPICGAGLMGEVSRAVCAEGHAFDIARQGYLNLGASQKDARADSASMVMARESVQASGAFHGIADALCEAAVRALCRTHQAGDAEVSGGVRVVDLAGGTGFYTSRVLEHLTEARDPVSHLVQGLVLDLSVPALKRAARAHPALAAVGVDLTRGIPLRDASVDLMLNVFGPRNGAEMRRVLRPGGVCIVVAPRPQHLAEIVASIGMLRVAPDKAERVAHAMQGFIAADTVACTYTRELTNIDVQHLIRMGPSAHHLSDTDMDARLSELFGNGQGARIPVTFSVDITTFTPEAQPMLGEEVSTMLEEENTP